MTTNKPKVPLLGKVALLAAAVAALVLFLVFGLRPTAIVAPVVRGNAPDARTGSVVVDAEYYMDIKSEIGGRIASSELEPGKRFAKGDVLVRIDPRDIEIEIERLESDYETLKRRIAVGSATELELDAAKERLETLERLYKQGQASENDLAQHRRSIRGIEQRLELEKVNNEHQLATQENALKAKRRQLDKMTIRAPFDGVVSLVLARPGGLIGHGDPIARMISTSRTVLARISEENFAGIEIGQRASVRFLGYGSTLYPARVDKILPTADPDTQRYSVFLEVEIDPEILVPGITGDVSIVAGEHQNTLIIPRRALFGNNVYVVTNGRVELRQVQTGFTSLNHVEILEGLSESELVVVDQLDTFRDGDRVRVQREDT